MCKIYGVDITSSNLDDLDNIKNDETGIYKYIVSDIIYSLTNISKGDMISNIINLSKDLSETYKDRAYEENIDIDGKIHEIIQSCPNLYKIIPNI